MFRIAFFLLAPLSALAADDLLFSSVGIAAPVKQAEAIEKAGGEFLTESVGRLLVPDESDQAFAMRLAEARAASLPILACNSFIRPKHLRCVGREANHDEVLEWAEITFRRAEQVGVKFIVFGSGGSRRLKEEWTKEQADPQFIALLKRMGPLARAHGITVVLEQLNRRECNYINTLTEAAAIVRAVGDPNVRLLADLYHMAMEGETPDDLARAMDCVVHVEIAEKEGRTVPGVGGVDFRPFFAVLRKHDYHGAISIEGRWELEQLPQAFATIREQAGGSE